MIVFILKGLFDISIISPAKTMFPGGYLLCFASLGIVLTAEPGETNSQSNMVPHQFSIVCHWFLVCSHACDLLHINYRHFNNLILVCRHLERTCKITETISLWWNFKSPSLWLIIHSDTDYPSYSSHTHSSLKCTLSSVLSPPQHGDAEVNDVTVSARGACWELRPDSWGDKENERLSSRDRDVT